MSAQPPPPTLNDILTAMAALRPQQAPPPADEKGIAKHAASIVVAIIMALCLWVGASVYTLNTTTTQVATKVDSMQKVLDDFAQQQNAITQRMADMQAAQARQDGRLLAIEQDSVRMRERMRIVEGQKPLQLGGQRNEP